MKIIIIGGVAAGMSAAAKARRVNKNAEIVVYTDEKEISYAACGIPYAISGVTESFNKLLIRSVENFKVENVTVKTGFYVESITLATKKLSILDLSKNTHIEDSYDKLIIATGARAIIPNIPGVKLKNVHIIRTYSDGLKLASTLENCPNPKVVIIGGGYIGLEMAETFSSFGARVSIVEAAPQLAANMDKEIATQIEEHLKINKVTTYLSEKVTAIEGSESVEQVITDKRTIPADLVLLAVGIRPNSEIAKAAGIVTGPKAAILIDKYGRTSAEDVYAAGDCATITSLLTQKDTYIPLGTNANKQGRVAGENAAGGSAKLEGVLGTAIAKVFDIEIARTGLSEEELKAEQIAYLTTTINSKTKPPYYPGAENISIKLNFDKSGKIWGGQIVGGKGTGKRIDILAAAITGGLTLDQMARLDLSYAPPFSTVWDPILIAAEQGLKHIK